MKSTKLLIDLVREKVGTDAEVARRVGVPRSHVAQWRSGVRAMSPESAVALCDVLELPGEEVREWVAIAMIENPKNSSKAELLRRALFACWVLGVGSLAMLSNDAQASMRRLIATEAAYTSVTDSLHIVVHWLRVKLARLARRFRLPAHAAPLMAG